MNDITSFQTLIGTLYKKFNKASVYGKLDLKNLYILDILNTLLNGCPTCLSETHKNAIKNLIIRIQYSDKDICIYRENRNIYFNNDISLNNNEYKVINTAPVITNPPSSINEMEEIGDSINFTENTFTNNYYDAEGNLPFKVKIITLPTNGILTFNNIPITSGFIFNIGDSEQLKYTRNTNIAYIDTINFKVSDNNLNTLYSNMATITITVEEYVNLPPDEIGDNTLTVNNRQTLVFSQADFTTNTTPPYEDPEGDGPYKLKVKTLPTQGVLKLNGVNVTVNQEILFTQINSGLLTYESLNADPSYSVNFDFDVSDLGSQQFSGL